MAGVFTKGVTWRVRGVGEPPDVEVSVHAIRFLGASVFAGAWARSNDLKRGQMGPNPKKSIPAPLSPGHPRGSVFDRPAAPVLQFAGILPLSFAAWSC